MPHIVLSCDGVPPSAGPEAAADITKEFTENRTWHMNAKCVWDGTKLILEADNDFDTTGAALSDEFSDCISAYVAEPFDGQILIVSIVPGASA